MKRHQFSFRALLLLVTFAAVVAYSLRPKVVVATIRVTDVHTESDDAGKAYQAAQVEVRNDSQYVLWYQAIREGAPGFGTEQHREGKKQLTAYSGGAKWLNWYRLESGDKLMFHVPLFSDTTKYRLGLRLYARRHGKPTPIWTELKAIKDVSD